MFMCIPLKAKKLAIESSYMSEIWLLGKNDKQLNELIVPAEQYSLCICFTSIVYFHNLSIGLVVLTFEHEFH